MLTGIVLVSLGVILPIISLDQAVIVLHFVLWVSFLLVFLKGRQKDSKWNGNRPVSTEGVFFWLGLLIINITAILLSGVWLFP
ncbi:MAG: hypothetical protein AAB443_02385 [Patescibacteria group bacterium]